MPNSLKNDRLVLIDGHAIIHRAYHALPPMTAPWGQQVSAVYGFVSILLRVINELSPTHMAVCFDLPHPTFRHEAYIAYQSQRPPSDQEMRDQIDIVRDVVECSGLPIYTARGFEADDVIGTLAVQAVQANGSELEQMGANKMDEVIIVTGDKDIMQLVSDEKHIKVFAPIKGIAQAKLLGEEEVEEYVGVAASKIVDFKALIGDSSDNYPGVPGIGPKTAVGLLDKFGTLEEIYRRLEEGKGRLAPIGSGFEGVSDAVVEKLRAGRESAMLSFHLATIRTDAPVELDLEKAKLGDFSKNTVFIDKLKQLGFKSLVTRIGGEVGQSKLKSRLKKEKKDNGQMGLL